MLKLDEFESRFRSADKARYAYTEVSIQRVVVFTDLAEEPSRRFAGDVKTMLSTLDADVAWTVVNGTEFRQIDELLAHVERLQPDLICTYRNLHGRARRFAFSLGGHVDVLTQATTTPVLLLPDPTDDDRLPERCQKT
ncbi:MAG: hypothetical protein KC657_19060, partial [Myxococcales bacterium]|nr:hypothetical protein [Myxococcales bacterium]